MSPPYMAMGHTDLSQYIVGLNNWDWRTSLITQYVTGLNIWGLQTGVSTLRG